MDQTAHIQTRVNNDIIIIAAMTMLYVTMHSCGPVDAPQCGLQHNDVPDTLGGLSLPKLPLHCNPTLDEPHVNQ